MSVTRADRIDLIADTIHSYLSGGVALTPERVKELACNIDSALTYHQPPSPDSEAVVTLRLVKALLDEALRPRLIGPA